MTKTAKGLTAWLGLLCFLMAPCASLAESPQDALPAPAGQSTSQPKEAAPASDTVTQPATHARKQTQHAKPSTTLDAQPPASAAHTLDLSKIEQTALRNLDTAVQFARKMKIAPPPNWQSTDPSADAFSKKQTDLQQAFTGSSNQSSQAQALNQTTEALNDLLTAISTHSVLPASPPEENNPATAVSANAGLLGRLPLLLASTALIVSLLALWRGWFLTRREVERALTEAGLL